MGKVKKNVKRIFCIILLVIFLPIILVYLLVKKITYNARLKQWKKKGLSGKDLVLLTDIDYIDKMQDFEAKDFFKYLFFFDGFNVKNLKSKKNNPQFFITKNNEEYLVLFSNNKNKSYKSELNILVDYKNGNNYSKALYVTNKTIDTMIKESYIAKSVKILDREELTGYLTKVQTQIKQSSSYTSIETKSISEQLDEMYPNRI